MCSTRVVLVILLARFCRTRLVQIDHTFGIRTHDRLYSNTGANHPAEGTQMTVIDVEYSTVPKLTQDVHRPARRRGAPISVRPGHRIAYRGSVVTMSRAPHRPRPAGLVMTVTLACLA